MKYVVNFGTKRVHIRTEEGYSFEQCNLDQIKVKDEFRTLPLGYLLCKRCFKNES